MAVKPRVIVVGGGPIGLFTAHALAKAHIDYVILEANHEIVRLRGAGIVLLPNTMRLLDQLGLLERAEKRGTVLGDIVNSLHNGRQLCRFGLFGPMKEAFGYPTIGFSRRDLIEILYETLPERESRIKVNARVVDIESNDDGVRVHLEDGSIEEGSLVIGVDGVHSKTREIMNRLARASSEKTSEEAYPMVASYQGLFGRCPRQEDAEVGVFYETHGTGVATQIVNGNEFAYYAIFRALPEQTTKRRRYTQEEVEEEAKKVAHINIFPNVKYEKLWANCDHEKDVSLVHLEEGILDRWHHGRIVVLGDALHKMTPANGQGVNCGFQSATVLVNKLYGILNSGADFTNENLEKAFSEYKSIRYPSARELYDQGIMITRLITWTTWTGWFFDRFIMPWMNIEDKVKQQSHPKTANGHILDFIPFEGKSGSHPWTNVQKTAA